MTSTTPSNEHRIVVEPPGRGISLPDPKLLWDAREVVYRFSVRDVKLRYRQTALGVIWVIAQPLLGAGIFAIIFGSVAGLPSDGVPYFMLTMAGMLAWTLFSNVVIGSCESLVGNSSLISKVFFPRILVPMSTIGSRLIDFGITFAFFVVLLFVYRINPGWPVLLLPLWTLLVIMMALGIGFAMSALMVYYRDVPYVLNFAMQMLMWASPVAFALSAVPDKYQWIFNANPLTWILQEFRWSLLGQDAPTAGQIIGSIVAATLVLLAGTAVFQKFERGFADVI